MKVTMLPDFTAKNPYQWELVRSLGALGVHVTLTNGLGAQPVLGAIDAYGTPDVLHLHWTHPYMHEPSALIEGLKMAASRGCGIVWTVHNLSAHESGDHEREANAHRSLVGVAHRVIVHCDAARRATVETYGLDEREAGKIAVVRHGHYLDAYEREMTRSQARRRLGIAAGLYVYLFLGQIRRYKGIPGLVGAFDRLGNGNARLVIAGAASNEEDLRWLRSRVGGRGDVLLHAGHVPDQEIQTYLRASNVVVLPYADVLTSGSAILALSFGTPLVVPSTGCLPETVPAAAAAFYDPADPDGLMQALVRVRQRDPVEMESAARAAAAALDWRAIALRTLELYRSAAPGADLREPVHIHERPAEARARAAIEDLLEAAPRGSAVAVADCGTWSLPPELEGRTVVRFLEESGEYWEAPWEETRAVEELRRLRQAGASFFALGDAAAWWLDQFTALRDELVRYPVVKKTDRVEVYDLR